MIIWLYFRTQNKITDCKSLNLNIFRANWEDDFYEYGILLGQNVDTREKFGLDIEKIHSTLNEKGIEAFSFYLWLE